MEDEELQTIFNEGPLEEIMEECEIENSEETEVTSDENENN